MYTDGKLWIAQSDRNICLLPQMANRHGLVAGATGTGKTITLKVLAESFSDLGVPVFLADVKGDVSGMAAPGVDSEGMQKRIAKFGLADAGFAYRGYPVQFWDVYQEKGHPVRATVSEMGPMLLSRIMDLNDTQEGVLDIVFRVADDQGLLLLDLKDLKAMVQYVGDHAAELKSEYGAIPTQSIGAITRQLLNLEDAGGGVFFGEPALDLADWMRCDGEGHGYINILHCAKLFLNPKLYSTFLLWMLSELFERLPEIGDMDKPKMVFFFDEAHLLFRDTPAPLLEKIEQVVRLIRSKGVGIYFITQSPTDIPDTVLAQLGNRIQHALRAYSPSEQKAVKVAAETFRENPAFKTAEVITALGTGEALISFLDEEGRPSIVEQARILPPQSLMAPLDDAKRAALMKQSPMGAKYDEAIDRESAYEKLSQKVQCAAAEEENAKLKEEALKEAKAELAAEAKAKKEQDAYDRQLAREQAAADREAAREARERAKMINKVAGTALNTLGREVSKSLSRGLMGLLRR